ncbi:MAG: aquaporin [Alphaproteobacteria bacterium]|nr:aquaporin [Alphaproteobacteria bacterium]
MKNYLSEFIGTFGFVLIGWGTVVFAAPFVGYLGISMAFGLAYAAVSFAFCSGHFNPAVTVAAALSGQFAAKSKTKTALKVIGFLLMQLAGACAAAASVYFIYSGKTGYVYQGMSGANIIDRYTLSSAFYLETLLCFLFLCVFLGTSKETKARPIACGSFITAAYLLSYPVTKGALNPVRSTAAALFSTEEALAQLPLFWGAALTAAVIAGLVYNPAVSRLFQKQNKIS